MSVWVCIPSARPLADVVKWAAVWRERGYSIALYRDDGGWTPEWAAAGVDIVSTPPVGNGYPGYARACNELIHSVMAVDKGAEWFVTGGDDVLPDPNHTAQEIAAQCSDKFYDIGDDLRDHAPRPEVRSVMDAMSDREHATFGLMQPTGDRFAGGSIDRIAGSPWIGREFARRTYGGRGPYWPEYEHMFVDEEIQEVAQRLGVFWQRPDLNHHHAHFMRESAAVDSRAIIDAAHQRPPHLDKWNTREHWDAMKAIFTARKAAGFPGSEPL